MTIADFFKENRKCAIAFSGGVDSAYLLGEAIKKKADVKAYYVKSAFQPEFEREDAIRTAEKLGAEMHEIEVDILADETVAANPDDRCYHCKNRIMGAIIEAAKNDGYEIICDGTNADDDISDRPGYRALQELGVRSPLKDCGVTKAKVREGLREAGVDIWDKPAYACLATRIATGERISEEKLRKTEEAEDTIRDMGFRDFRVRQKDNRALVQVKEDQLRRAHSMEEDIKTALGKLYDSVDIDQRGR